MQTVLLPSGERVPALGQGTWHMGEWPARRRDEVASLRLGIELGLTLIDTAEMYGEGRAEQVVAEAIGGVRDRVFLVDKVLPHHATRAGTIAACEKSLQRLDTDRIDLYLLHWRGTVPLEETLGGFDALWAAGKIRHWGVSNFDVGDLNELVSLRGGDELQADQILYNLSRRGPELELIPCLRARSIPVMAYSPLEQGRLLESDNLADFARRHEMTIAQAALAWLLSHDDVIPIPKASHPDRVRENAEALDIRLSQSQIEEPERLFPPPRVPVPLEML